MFLLFILRGFQRPRIQITVWCTLGAGAEVCTAKSTDPRNPDIIRHP
jgi:hypothetical protein